jgi:hypothetical protein
MKTTIAIIGVCVAFYGNVQAQTNQPVQPAKLISKNLNPFSIKFPNPLKTRSGRNYNDVELQEVKPDKINVVYYDDNGLFQTDFIQLSDLPPDLQSQFGYVTDKNAPTNVVQKSTFVMTPELQKYYDQQILERRQMEADEAAKQAEEAKEAEKEREDKEKADAALLEAQKPPVQVNVIQQQQQQQ